MSACFCLPTGIGQPYFLVDLLTSSFVGPILELQSSPTDNLLITEIALKHLGPVGGAAGIVFGVGRPAAQGVGINPYRLSYEDSANNSTSPNIAVLTNWSVPPTIPTNFFRRISINTSNGYQTEFLMPFQRGLRLAPSSSLVVWVIATGNIGNRFFDVRVGYDA